MRRALKILVCSFVFALLLSFDVIAKPVHTSLFTGSAENFVLIINSCMQQKNINLPLISTLIPIEDGSDTENTYLGSWGSSTVIIKEDTASKSINYISISLPSYFYSEELEIESKNYFSELGLMCGVIAGLNENISDTEINTAYKELKDGFVSKKSCSCSAGKVHYDWIFSDNVMIMSYSAITDDGTK